MTADYIEKIALELKSNKIKYIIHTSRTDDKIKSYLEDVNKYWTPLRSSDLHGRTKYQVVLYSPCIESGVDVNVEHFDKIYGVLKSGSTTCSQRAFLQMIGRIRKVTSPIIHCLYNGPVNIDSRI